jgi:hypothetical protein
VKDYDIFTDVQLENMALDLFCKKLRRSRTDIKQEWLAYATARRLQDQEYNPIVDYLIVGGRAREIAYQHRNKLHAIAKAWHRAKSRAKFSADYPHVARGHFARTE